MKIKNIVYRLAFMLICLIFVGQVSAQEKKYPVMSFEKDQTKYDFGDVLRDSSVSHTFKFKNTGSAALVIADASSSCGCTKPIYPKKPIKPGESGEIKITFNGTGWERFTKSITLVVNTREGRQILYITGNIVETN